MYSTMTYNEKFDLAQNFIKNEEFQKAYDLLTDIVDKSNANWNYFMGLTSLKLGYYEQGENHLKKAVELDPNNKIYEDAIIKYNNNYNSYNDRAYNYNRRRQSNSSGCCCCCCDCCDCCCCGDDFCEVCTKLWCLDTICECFGGDFITCC